MSTIQFQGTKQWISGQSSFAGIMQTLCTAVMYTGLRLNYTQCTVMAKNSIFLSTWYKIGVVQMFLAELAPLQWPGKEYHYKQPFDKLCRSHHQIQLYGFMHMWNAIHSPLLARQIVRVHIYGPLQIKVDSPEGTGTLLTQPSPISTVKNALLANS